MTDTNEPQSTEPQSTEPQRIDADQQPSADVEGTSTGNPVAGVEMDEEQKEQAVEPDDNSALEVDGPQAGHA